VVNALSFDLEDWFHIIGIAELEDDARWHALPSIFETYTAAILDELDLHGVRGTFFVVGWIARRYPEMIREVARRGHEIGSHSDMHRTVGQLGPQAFADDLARSLDALAACTSQRIRGFRAPSFSITPGCEWAFDALLDAGLDYDASLFPATRAHGGYPCPEAPHVQSAPSGRRIRALPMTTMRIAGRRVAFSGGGYLRLLPGAAIRAGFRQAHAAGRPVTVYLHPRDFAPDAPLPPLPLHRRFKTRVGLKTTRAKLRDLLARYDFDTCAAVLDRALA
jgi:polysaccharide deacetylase family protein (PEP-CTERM system associated)